MHHKSVSPHSTEDIQLMLKSITTVKSVAHHGDVTYEEQQMKYDEMCQNQIILPDV